VSSSDEAIRFLSADGPISHAEWVLLGCPLEETVTFRPGTQEGPAGLRAASHGLETYSPRLRRDLTDLSIADAGDLDFLRGSRESGKDLVRPLETIRSKSAEIVRSEKRILALGGEHLITLPLAEAILEKHPDLLVLQLDAHADLRDAYEKDRYSHATVMRRLLDLSENVTLIQCGIRSGTREEMDFSRRSIQVQPAVQENLSGVLDGFTGRPLYLSLDLDVLDPSVLPGTGTPEPGGWTFLELESIIHRLKGRNVVGADVVELSPGIDPSGISSVTAASAVREILLAC